MMAAKNRGGGVENGGLPGGDVALRPDNQAERHHIVEKARNGEGQ